MTLHGCAESIVTEKWHASVGSLGPKRPGVSSPRSTYVHINMRSNGVEKALLSKVRYADLVYRLDLAGCCPGVQEGPNPSILVLFFQFTRKGKH